MMFTKTTSEETTVLQIQGELDAMATPELRTTLDEIAQAQPKKVVVDLSGLELVDSSGVGAIVSLFKRVRSMGGEFEVVGVQGQPRSIFKVLRLDRVFHIQ